MFTLDPGKLLIIAVVALLVLGPDKLPAAAKTASGLLRDLRRLRTSLHEQVTTAVGADPMMSGLTEAKDHLTRLRGSMQSRAALYQSIGLSDKEISLWAQEPGRAADGEELAPLVPDAGAVASVRALATATLPDDPTNN